MSNIADRDVKSVKSKYNRENKFNRGDMNSNYYNSGDKNGGSFNCGNHNSGYYNAGSNNSGDGNAGNSNSGNRNCGGFNSGSNVSGYFCSEPDKVRLFNKPTDMTHEEFVASIYWQAVLSAPFKLTEWIEQENALKMYSYKEACANWWKRLSEKNKTIIKQMPNFDSTVFENITGIKI